MNTIVSELQKSITYRQTDIQTAIGVESLSGLKYVSTSENLFKLDADHNLIFDTVYLIQNKLLQ